MREMTMRNGWLPTRLEMPGAPCRWCLTRQVRNVAGGPDAPFYRAGEIHAVDGEPRWYASAEEAFEALEAL